MRVDRSFADFLPFALSLADMARIKALPYFRQKLSIDSKQDRSPVTRADQETESAIRQMIAQSYPDHGIFGEEMGQQKITEDYVWVIDPIDGTRAFILGIPLFGCLIALLYQGRPVLGIIDMPALNERWIGIEGQASYWLCAAQSNTVSASDCQYLADARVAATSPDMFNSQQRQRFDHISLQARDRRFGCDCYGFGLLAAGLIDVVMEADLKPYDYLALVPILQGAGAVITDWQGRTLSLHSQTGEVLAAANATLHADILSQLNHFS